MDINPKDTFARTIALFSQADEAKMDIIDLSLLSPEDRALHDRCALHGVPFIPPDDSRNELPIEKTKRHESMKTLIKKQLCAERQRKRRMLMTEAARKDQRLRDANRQRRRRALMTDDERKDQRYRDAERQRQRRADLSSEQREEQRQRDKERQRKRRARLGVGNQSNSSETSASKESTEELTTGLDSLPLGSGSISSVHHHVKLDESAVVRNDDQHSSASEDEVHLESVLKSTNGAFLQGSDERGEPQDSKLHVNTSAF